MEEPSQPSSALRPPATTRAAAGRTYSPSPSGDGAAFAGEHFQQLLLDACTGRLGPIRWFRTDWQRGGAMTGYSTFQADDGALMPVVVKLPVPPGERRWLAALQHANDVAPRLHAHGETLGGYDMAWVVMEQLPHGPLCGSWDGREFDLLVEAAGRFYAAARDLPIAGPPPARDWDAIFHRARENVRVHDVRDEQRWGKALKKAHRKLKGWAALWHDRPTDQWCHGDLHLGNAMTRTAPPDGPALLLDFAQTHPGCWVEDAVYFEHLYWARRDRLAGRKVCSMLARERKRHGLPVDVDWPRLAAVRRALMALSTPAMLQHDGDPLHVSACLEILEMEVGI